MDIGVPNPSMVVVEAAETDPLQREKLSPSSSGFKMGEMVWGKVKSHPWWPGQIFDEAFVLNSVLATKCEGHLLVAFFGDSSYGWFHPSELIPFEPHFPEKSKQTSSRNFVIAVDEAVDEVSRRSALSLTCLCGKNSNFRSTSVRGFFSVDLVGYVPGWVYPSSLIDEARERFAPSDMLSFLHSLAVTPMKGGTKSKSIESIKGIGVLLAYRRRVFEELDETYAEAFGTQPVPSTKNEFGIPDQRDRFAPRAAPLSGRLVISEVSGGKNGANKTVARTTAAKPRSFDLKRRDETPPTKTRPPDSRAAAFLPPPPAVAAAVVPTATSSAAKKRASDETLAVPKIKKAARVDGKSDPSFPKIESLVPHRSELTPATAIPPANSSKPRSALEELDDWMKGPPPQTPAVATDFDDARDLIKKKKIKMCNEVKESKRPTKPAMPNMGPKEIELPRLVTDLYALAVDPLYGIERDALGIVLHCFLRFRSIVYKKSLVLANVGEAKAAERDVKVARKSESSLKPSKPVSRVDDPTFVGLKRAPLDRRVEIPAKRLNKLRRLDAPASETNAGVIQAPPKAPQREQDPVEKQQQLPSKPTPTFLVLKFPQGTMLPSVSSLKVKFGRFGALDVSGFRILWKSHSCRVLYKYKPDAQTAYNHARKNDLFGQVKVQYSLREHETPSEPQYQPNDGPNSSVQQRSLSRQQPKPILKKPGDEARDFTRETPRVKFVLGGDDHRIHPAIVAKSNNRVGGPEPRSIEFLQSQPRQSLPRLPEAPFFTRLRPPPPPPKPLLHANVAEYQRVGSYIEAPVVEISDGRARKREGYRRGPDIEQPMLRLLATCNDIVANLHGVLGYVPYHPI